MCSVEKEGFNMPEIQLGAHTFQSHGVTVARFHMHDWIVLLLLMIIEIILNVIEPFHRFVGKNMMTDLSYPLKSNTVPFWAVPLIGIVLPLVVFGAIYFRRRDVYDMHHAALDDTILIESFKHPGILYSVLITGVITDAIKDGVGRPRPDFFWRCFPNGTGIYDPVTLGVLCNGDPKVIKEGHKSFPSGHTSCCFVPKLMFYILLYIRENRSFAGMVFLAWYLGGKVRVFDRKGHIAKLCLVLLPLLVAALVGVSRVDDYWHHWQDVFGGAIIGTTVATFCYLQFFPYPHDDNGWAPYAYFNMMNEMNTSQMNSTTNQTTMYQLEYIRETV
ncbi:LOW QUALITY PROTEIN: hypothetical protein V2J09_014867 [Rumex salicifolius]